MQYSAIFKHSLQIYKTIYYNAFNHDFSFFRIFENVLHNLHLSHYTSMKGSNLSNNNKTF